MKIDAARTVTMSRREVIRGLAAGSVVVIAPGCAYNAELGRNQLLFVSQGQMAQLASSAWTDLKRSRSHTPPSHPRTTSTP